MGKNELRDSKSLSDEAVHVSCYRQTKRTAARIRFPKASRYAIN